MGVQGQLESFGKGAYLHAANAPILTGGQLVIAGMKLTTGTGEPEDGARFGQGGARLHGSAATLMSAQPTASWAGSAASSYSAQNIRQMTRTRTLAAVDHEVHGVLATEAYQVGFHRNRLDDAYNWLADVGLVTSALGVIPGVGAGLKAAADAQAVVVAVGRSSVELAQLSSEVDTNAAALQRLVGRYENVEQTAQLSETAADHDPPPPPLPEEERQEDEPGDKAPDAEPPTPPSKPHPAEPTQGMPAQFVARPSMGGTAPARAAVAPSPAVGQAPAPPPRSAAGAPPMGAMPPAAMSAGAAPMAPAPGIPVGLFKEAIKEAVVAALKEEAERQAAEDQKEQEDEGEEVEEDEDGDDKPDEASDDDAAGQGRNDTSQLTPPIAVTVDLENPIGPPPAPRT